jgi:hypothetical protein
MRRRVSVRALIAIVAVLTTTSCLFVGLTPTPAAAAPIVYPNRARAELGSEYASGSAIDGVTSDLWVSSVLIGSTTSVASDIYMVNYGLAGPQFVQFGIIQGNVYFGSYNYVNGQCVIAHPLDNLTYPHLFIGAQLSTQPCETLRDLGPFGSTDTWRHFGLRRNSDGTYYARLDSVVKYTTSIAFPAAMEPGVVAEENDTCGYTTTDAETSGGGSTLQWHDNARGWQYWTEQFNSSELYHPTLWDIYRPNGTAKTYHADGDSPLPGEC